MASAARRATTRRNHIDGRPPSPPLISAADFAVFSQHEQHLPSRGDTLRRPSTASPLLSRPVRTPPTLGVDTFPLPETHHHQPNQQRHLPRSRFSRSGDPDQTTGQPEAEYQGYTDEDRLWSRSPAPYLISGGCRSSGGAGKRTPDSSVRSSSAMGRQYPAYTTAPANKISRFPGPGSYDTSLKSGGPSFSIGSRDSLRVGHGAVGSATSFSPGPGAYDVKWRTSGPSFSMGPRVRAPMSQRDMNPGPGTYSDLSTSFGRGLSFTMREKLK